VLPIDLEFFILTKAEQIFIDDYQNKAQKVPPEIDSLVH